jgi:hypothetical protein
MPGIRHVQRLLAAALYQSPPAAPQQPQNAIAKQHRSMYLLLAVAVGNRRGAIVSGISVPHSH